MGKTKIDIAITGGTGYLGSRLAQRLCKKNKIIILKRSFDDISRIDNFRNEIKQFDTDKNSYSDFFEKYECDAIIHTATLYGKNEPLSDVINSNLIFPLELLQSAIKNNVSCFINTDTVLERLTNPYSISKKQFVDWVIYFSDKIKIVNVKLESFYGPQDNSSRFISYLVKEMLENVSSIDLTYGEQERDFIYIEDVIDFYEIILLNLKHMDKNYNEYHLGSGQLISIKNLSLMIKKLTGSHSRLNFGALPYRENELMQSKVDLEIFKELNWHPKINLENGIKKTIEFEKNRIINE